MNAFCNRTADTPSISLNERLVFVSSIVIMFVLKSGSKKI